MENLKKTPLCEEHIKLNARMVDFAGWYMPVQYTGVIDEHQNVRNNVGLFDVSHMGEIFFKGPKALETLQWLTSNDVSVLENGQAQYSLLMNPQGAMVDDIIIYCLEKNKNYLVCVNASNADKDFSWMKANNKGAEIINESNNWAQIAIQGPKAEALLKDVLGEKATTPKYFQFTQVDQLIVARTGYTGEDGFEVFLPKDQAVKFWQDLLAKGQKYQASAIGLGARDTLRTEMKYSLYGHEIDDTTNAFEAGLGWVVKMSKPDFIGRAALEASKKKGLKQKLIGFKMIDKGIPRAGYDLFSFDNVQIGRVTSGTMSPTLREPIGIGYLNLQNAEIGQEFFVQIRGRNCKAVVVKTPFVNVKK
ncbi:MAG: glycine cleavage system aminomethyltransferase GcvT [Oligoflexia bacterium]|nr:glycine cleavage system aminomethyltransferase GcvT [Oligoflexia bacterium]